MLWDATNKGKAYIIDDYREASSWRCCAGD